MLKLILSGIGSVLVAIGMSMVIVNFLGLTDIGAFIVPFLLGIFVPGRIMGWIYKEEIKAYMSGQSGE